MQELMEFKLPASSSPREGIRRLTLPTPSENKIMIEQGEHIHKMENLYTCCCFKGSTDRRLLTFLAQLGLSTLVMVFCIYKLSVDNSCACKDNNQNTFYSSVLMTILGLFMPAPRPLH